MECGGGGGREQGWLEVGGREGLLEVAVEGGWVAGQPACACEGRAELRAGRAAISQKHPSGPIGAVDTRPHQARPPTHILPANTGIGILDTLAITDNIAGHAPGARADRTVIGWVRACHCAGLALYVVATVCHAVGDGGRVWHEAKGKTYFAGVAGLAI